AATATQGLDWKEFSPDAEQLEVTLRLADEFVFRGRLVDLQGVPAARVKLHVTYLARGDYRGVREPAEDVAAWLGPVTTDADGRSPLRVPGALRTLILQPRDERFARQLLCVATGDKERTEEIAFSLVPARVLTGRVTYADTERPAAGARLLAMTPGQNFYGTTDADGRYELPIFADHRFQLATGNAQTVQVFATPPDGAPYLILKKFTDWPKGAVRHTFNLALPRGILVSGKIADAGSGKPLVGAEVQYFPRQDDNPELRP